MQVGLPDFAPHLSRAAEESKFAALGRMVMAGVATERSHTGEVEFSVVQSALMCCPAGARALAQQRHRENGG
jgi:hypothetical protein